MAPKARNLHKGEHHKDSQGRDIICCYCGNDMISKQGVTKHNTQQYYCQHCKKIFSTNTRHYLEMMNLTVERRYKIEFAKTLWTIFNMSILANIDDYLDEQWAWG